VFEASLRPRWTAAQQLGAAETNLSLITVPHRRGALHRSGPHSRIAAQGRSETISVHRALEHAGQLAPVGEIAHIVVLGKMQVPRFALLNDGDWHLGHGDAHATGHRQPSGKQAGS
jgi:hypothetical protein